MKTLSRRNQIFRSRYCYQSSSLDKLSGTFRSIEDSNGMKIPEYLKKCVSAAGGYFSISRRAQIKANPVTRKGVESLQTVLRESSIYFLAFTELSKGAGFREHLENNPLCAGSFIHSLRDFDQKKKLFDGSDGDYGHSTRLAVAYVQYKAGIKVDGVLGKQTLSLLGGTLAVKEKEMVSDFTQGALRDLSHEFKPLKSTVNTLNKALIGPEKTLETILKSPAEIAVLTRPENIDSAFIKSAKIVRLVTDSNTGFVFKNRQEKEIFKIPSSDLSNVLKIELNTGKNIFCVVDNAGVFYQSSNTEDTFVETQNFFISRKTGKLQSRGKPQPVD